ncbi:hypothetical protein B4124_4316 [Bacillus licheniformis]|nr:hypothetical protein B4124_4316 [Bacillus licheniformis]
MREKLKQVGKMFWRVNVTYETWSVLVLTNFLTYLISKKDTDQFGSLKSFANRQKVITPI